MSNGSDEIELPNPFLHRVSWQTSRRHSWCPDPCAWCPQVPSSHLQLRICSTISGRTLMMMLRHSTQIQEASQRLQQASNISNGNFKRGLSHSSDTLKSSETVLLVSLPITNRAIFPMRMWLGYPSIITLWILPLQELWRIGSVQATARLQISRYEDVLHWLDGCSRS